MLLLLLLILLLVLLLLLLIIIIIIIIIIPISPSSFLSALIDSTAPPKSTPVMQCDTFQLRPSDRDIAVIRSNFSGEASGAYQRGKTQPRRWEMSRFYLWGDYRGLLLCMESSWIIYKRQGFDSRYERPINSYPSSTCLECEPSSHLPMSCSPHYGYLRVQYWKIRKWSFWPRIGEIDWYRLIH